MAKGDFTPDCGRVHLGCCGVRHRRLYLRSFSSSALLVRLLIFAFTAVVDDVVFHGADDFPLDFDAIFSHVLDTHLYPTIFDDAGPQRVVEDEQTIPQ